jgi:hypothetical protein
MQLEILDVGSRRADRWLAGRDSSEGWGGWADLSAPDELGAFHGVEEPPVEQIRKVELAVNLKIATALGLPCLPARPG